MSAATEHHDEQSPLLVEDAPGFPSLEAQHTSTSQPSTRSPTPAPGASQPPMPEATPALSQQPMPSPLPSRPSTPQPPTTPNPDPAPLYAQPSPPPTTPNPDSAPIFTESAPPPQPGIPKTETNHPWGKPIGAPVRDQMDENLIIFRRAVGINSDMSTAGTSNTLESGRRKAVGVYRDCIRVKKRKRYSFMALNSLLWICYLSQVLVGAALTGLGPGSADHPNLITSLGALNTVIAGLLALVRGQGLPERLRRDEKEFRKLQDWIEETEALLAVGVIGRDRKDVGSLVEMAFKKYNACKASEENNRPDSYVSQDIQGLGLPAGMGSSRNGSVSNLNVPRY